MNTKVCSTCKKEKSICDFYKSSQQKDGIHNSCKACCIASSRKSWLKNKKIREENGLCYGCGKPRDTIKKYCNKCLKTKRKYQDGFYFKRINNGLCGYCGKRPLKSKKACEYCLSKYFNERVSNPERRIYRAVKGHAKKKGIEFNLDISDISIPSFCPLLEIPIRVGDGVKTDNSPSVDRIDPKKGYIKGNVWIISDKANRMKNNATPEEIIRFAKNIQKTLINY